ncbi:MAG: SIR2 family protein [Clostridiales Family XIII bacterium]|jgi:hypothetical protein|nr:SIR2 family protein [Clostridiales Family XIII bacterium]
MGVYGRPKAPSLAEGLLGSRLQTKNKEEIDRLKGALGEESGLALCLGAGAAKDIGLPLWPELINDLMLRAIITDDSFCRLFWGDEAGSQDEIREQFLEAAQKPIFFKDINALELAEYVSVMLETQLEKTAKERLTEKNAEEGLRRLVLSALCEQWPEESHRTEAFHNEHGELIMALARLVVEERGVKQVLTYNFDDALEYAINQIQRDSAADSAKLLKIKSLRGRDCVYTDSNDGTERFIYHIHGYLPIFIKAAGAGGGDEDESTGGIILSERSYYGLEDELYEPTNICHAQLLTAHRCLFIGCSAQDHHFKRLTKGMADPGSGNGNREKTRHFICLDVNSVATGIYNTGNLAVINSSDLNENNVKYLMLQSALDMKRDYYEKHGFSPIYFAIDDPNDRRRKDLNRMLEYIMESIRH